jgi:hypothetical protein
VAGGEDGMQSGRLTMDRAFGVSAGSKMQAHGKSPTLRDGILCFNKESGSRILRAGFIDHEQFASFGFDRKTRTDHCIIKVRSRPMPRSYVIAKIGDASHRLDIAHRDWGIVRGRFFEEGARFDRALGVYENFTVAGGIPEGSFVARQRLLLLEATELFLRAIQRDEEFLRYDFSYSFSARGSRPQSGAESGFRVRGFVGHISTRPHGFCWLELSQLVGSGWPRVVEFIDMRVRGSIETDELGTLKIHRRKAEMHWLETLPPLVEFLRSQSGTEVRVEHYDS